MTKQVVLFDLDETLIDRSAAVRSFAQKLCPYLDQSTNTSQFVQQVVEIDALGYLPRGEFFAELNKRFGSFLPDGVIKDVFYAEVWETPILAAGVIDALKTLAEKQIPLGVISNGSKKAQETKLKKSDLWQYFDEVLVSESFGVKKPDPSIFLAAAKQLNAEISSSWYVGDHPVNDVWGSKQVGFQAAWVHLGRPWKGKAKLCFDLKGETFSDTMVPLLASIN